MEKQFYLIKSNDCNMIITGVFKELYRMSLYDSIIAYFSITGIPHDN